MAEIRESISFNIIRNTLIVVLPIDISDEDMDYLQIKLLTKLEEQNITGVILDLLMIELVDSFLARMIAETNHMISLMGCKSVIVGMRPNIAITTIELGLNLGNTLYALNLDKGLDLLEF